MARPVTLLAASALAFPGIALTGHAFGAGEAHSVLMRSVDYEPRLVKVRVGDTVEWTNEDVVAHTATAKDKSWDVNVLPRRNGRMLMKTAGTFSYLCRYHPNMTGEIVVEP